MSASKISLPSRVGIQARKIRTSPHIVPLVALGHSPSNISSHGDYPVPNCRKALPSAILGVLPGAPAPLLVSALQFDGMSSTVNIEPDDTKPDLRSSAARSNLTPGGAEVASFFQTASRLRAGGSAGMRVVGVQTHSADLKDVDLSVHDFEDPKLEAWLKAQN